MKRLLLAGALVAGAAGLALATGRRSNSPPAGTPGGAPGGGLPPAAGDGWDSEREAATVFAEANAKALFQWNPTLGAALAEYCEIQTGTPAEYLTAAYLAGPQPGYLDGLALAPPRAVCLWTPGAWAVGLPGSDLGAFSQAMDPRKAMMVLAFRLSPNGLSPTISDQTAADAMNAILGGAPVLTAAAVAYGRQVQLAADTLDIVASWTDDLTINLDGT